MLAKRLQLVRKMYFERPSEKSGLVRALAAICLNCRSMLAPSCDLPSKQAHHRGAWIGQAYTISHSSKSLAPCSSLASAVRSSSWAASSCHSGATARAACCASTCKSSNCSFSANAIASSASLFSLFACASALAVAHAISIVGSACWKNRSSSSSAYQFLFFGTLSDFACWRIFLAFERKLRSSVPTPFFTVSFSAKSLGTSAF
mmetsp:Transcript_90448/g.174111  ORF Transcript_90448/g.174111 Transcript_90448/m.174111 type:complete len:204 (+) Transcript_90448:42-653(+)